MACLQSLDLFMYTYSMFVYFKEKAQVSGTQSHIVDRLLMVRQVT